jgi:thiamine transporter ThiT
MMENFINACVRVVVSMFFCLVFWEACAPDGLIASVFGTMTNYAAAILAVLTLALVAYINRESFPFLRKRR